jgi:plasmid rolling circle replication initiator protein Rep
MYIENYNIIVFFLLWELKYNLGNKIFFQRMHIIENKWIEKIKNRGNLLCKRSTILMK